MSFLVLLLLSVSVHRLIVLCLCSVQNQSEAAEYSLNKVLSLARDQPNKPDHQAFVKQLRNCTAQMIEYTKEFHKTGLNWNIKARSCLLPACLPPELILCLSVYIGC